MPGLNGSSGRVLVPPDCVKLPVPELPMYSLLYNAIVMDPLTICSVPPSIVRSPPTVFAPVSVSVPEPTLPRFPAAIMLPFTVSGLAELLIHC